MPMIYMIYRTGGTFVPMIYMIYRTGESSFAREIIGVAAVPALLLPSFKRRQEQEDRVRVIELSDTRCEFLYRLLRSRSFDACSRSE